jgi:predicted phosphodiesterase
VAWAAIDPGTLTLVATTPRGAVVSEVKTESDGGPGAATLDQLPAGAELTLEVHGRVGRARAIERVPFRTIQPPPGAQLFKLATINDLHLGTDHFGYLGRMRERPEPRELHPVRCAHAAVHEALAWGAELLVVKGDLTDKGWPEQWELVGDLLAHLPVPVVVIPGNHDIGPYRTVDPQPALAQHGLHLTHGVEMVDLPGVRLVLVDTVRPGVDGGRIEYLRAEVCRVAARARNPILLAMHHHPQRFRYPTFKPEGIPGPEAHRFLEDLAAANPRTFVTTGHTHRHRRHEYGPITLTEVGSTKDYPGAWAGYVIHEGGIRQVVRRVARPDCIRWTEYTRRAVAGVWGRWSPGTLADRCFAVTWPPAPTPARATRRVQPTFTE